MDIIERRLRRCPAPGSGGRRFSRREGATAAVGGHRHEVPWDQRQVPREVPWRKSS